MKNIPIIIFLILLQGIILSAQGTSGWTIKSSMPTPRYDVCSAKLDHYIYIIGGIERDDDDDEEISEVVERYDPLSNSWSTDIKDINKERHDAAAVAFEGKIYVIGGRDDAGLVSEIEIYDPVSDDWDTSGHRLCQNRVGATAVAYAGKIYVMGGYNASGDYLDNIEIFDPASGIWEVAMQSMTFPRTSFAAVVLENSIYTFGGFYYGPLGVAEKYESGGNWQTISSMSTPRANFIACPINAKIYVLGGKGQAEILKSTEAYDPSTGKWTFKEALNYPRENFTAQVVDNKIYVFGGRNNSRKFIAAVEAYTPEMSAVALKNPSVPQNITLYPNYPNPFNGETHIKYEVVTKSHASGTHLVNLTIYNIEGEQVLALVNEEQLPGSYRVFWNGKDAYGKEMASGNYFCVLRAGGNIHTIKLSLVK